MYMNTTYSMIQSAVAMRKRMSDDTNKYNFNRKRVLDRIREGSIPQQNTTKKYDISNAEVNAIRKEGNHPPLVVAYAPAAYAPTLAVNEETKRIQAQYIEQQQLTENVKEDEQKLVQSFSFPNRICMVVSFACLPVMLMTQEVGCPSAPLFHT